MRLPSAGRESEIGNPKTALISWIELPVSALARLYESDPAKGWVEESLSEG